MSKQTVQLEPLSDAHKPLMPFLPAAMLDEALKPGSNFYAVRDDQKCVGIVAVRLEPNPDTPELLVFIDPAEHNKGYGTGAVAEVLRIAFAEMNLTEVYAGCRPGRAAAHIVEKLGFVSYHQQGDTVYYVLHRKKWGGA